MGTHMARWSSHAQRFTAEEVEGCFATHYVDGSKIESLESGPTRCGLTGVAEASLVYVGDVTCQLCRDWLDNYCRGTRV